MHNREWKWQQTRCASQLGEELKRQSLVACVGRLRLHRDGCLLKRQQYSGGDGEVAVQTELNAHRAHKAPNDGFGKISNNELFTSLIR